MQIVKNLNGLFIRLQVTHNVPLVLSVVFTRPCFEQRVYFINEDDARCKSICEALVEHY